MGCPVSTSRLFQKRSSVLLLLVSQKKKKERKGKENLVGFDRFFYKRSGGKILLRFPAFFSLSELYVDPQLIEYIPKSDARALRRKGRLERKQKRLRDLLLLLRRRRQNMKRKSWLRHAPTRATTIQQQQQNVDEFDGVTELQKEIIREQLQLHNHQHQEQQIRDACVASSQQLQASYGERNRWCTSKKTRILKGNDSKTDQSWQLLSQTTTKST